MARSPRAEYLENQVMDTHQENGGFRVHLLNEETLIDHLLEKALANTDKPGEAWHKLKVDAEEGEGGRGVVLYYLNVVHGTVEVTESWDGVETARKTLRVEIDATGWS